MAQEAAGGGWTVGATPLPFSVVVFPAGAFSSSVGHVAFVEAIQSGQLLNPDYNWGYIGSVVTTHWVMPRQARVTSTATADPVNTVARSLLASGQQLRPLICRACASDRPNHNLA